MDVTGGINFCKEKGYFEQDIIVDIIMCFGNFLKIIKLILHLNYQISNLNNKK